jgi:hypothetical protein
MSLEWVTNRIISLKVFGVNVMPHRQFGYNGLRARCRQRNALCASGGILKSPYRHLGIGSIWTRNNRK